MQLLSGRLAQKRPATACADPVSSKQPEEHVVEGQRRKAQEGAVVMGFRLLGAMLAQWSSLCRSMAVHTWHTNTTHSLCLDELRISKIETQLNRRHELDAVQIAAARVIGLEKLGTLMLQWLWISRVKAIHAWQTKAMRSICHHQLGVMAVSQRKAQGAVQTAAARMMGFEKLITLITHWSLLSRSHAVHLWHIRVKDSAHSVQLKIWRSQHVHNLDSVQVAASRVIALETMGALLLHWSVFCQVRAVHAWHIRATRSMCRHEVGALILNQRHEIDAVQIAAARVIGLEKLGTMLARWSWVSQAQAVHAWRFQALQSDRNPLYCSPSGKDLSLSRDTFSSPAADDFSMAGIIRPMPDGGIIRPMAQLEISTHQFRWSDDCAIEASFGRSPSPLAESRLDQLDHGKLLLCLIKARYERHSAMQMTRAVMVWAHNTALSLEQCVTMLDIATCQQLEVL